jgi:hypothetical protein
MTHTTYNYRVWDAGKIHQGSSTNILDTIRQGAENGEIKNMTVDQYAAALVNDAPYFLDQSLLDALQQVDYPTEYDRALNYLAAMPSSGVRILSRD